MIRGSILASMTALFIIHLPGQRPALSGGARMPPLGMQTSDTRSSAFFGANCRSVYFIITNIALLPLSAGQGAMSEAQRGSFGENGLFFMLPPNMGVTGSGLFSRFAARSCSQSQIFHGWKENRTFPHPVSMPYATRERTTRLPSRSYTAKWYAYLDTG